jgi:NodT family efflux transporter outer membrane factor (OMF) lipoprotein
LVALSLLLLTGCASLPKSVGPMPVPRGAESIAASQSLPASSLGQWPADLWWQAYGDPQLDALVAEGLTNSPDVAVAAARLRKATAFASQARAASLPTLDAQGSVSEAKQSYNTGFPPQFIAFLPHGWNDEGQLDLTLGFDPDFWGRNRAALAAATSERQAVAVEAQAAALVLSTSIVQTYADFGAALVLRDGRAAALTSRTATQSLFAQRLGQGLETRGSLRTADAQADSARADLAAADQALLLRRHQLAALLGAGPDRGLTIAAPHLAALGTRGLPEGVTTALLGRRPDLIAARARLEAAASRVKVARADFYPAVRLNALIGLQALGLGKLFNGGSTYGNVGPAISLPLFHGGALHGAYRGARADYDLAVADYDKLVLTAYQQVADAVTTRSLVARQLDYVRSAVAANEDAYSVAQARYRAGLSNYLNVLTVEDRLLDARVALALRDAAYRSADIGLVRALNGSFAVTAAQTGGAQQLTPAPFVAPPAPSNPLSPTQSLPSPAPATRKDSPHD